MEINVDNAIHSALLQQQLNIQQNVQVGMLKRAIDSQSEAALSLIASLPQPMTSAASGSLGQNIDTQA